MSTTLNLVDHLLARGRNFQQLGRVREALQILTRLAGFRELPAEAAEEAQVRLAQLHLRRRRYAKARRHLAAALMHDPSNPRYHYLMATAVRENDKGDLDRAARHYRRSLELDGLQVKCLCDFGLLAVRQGKVEDGLTRLRRAVEMAPDDPVVLGKLTKGLRLAGRTREARTELRNVLFRNPRDPRFRRLWGEFGYGLLRLRQENNRLAKGGARRQTGPVLLPFIRPKETTPTGEGSPTILRGPTPGRGDQRNVQ
jgi:tetratricopeptide (TPR) repeat protein